MAHVLVTGGCGFIGSHLCDALMRSGHRIRVLDDLSSGDAKNLVAGAELMLGSVADPEIVDSAMDGISSCIHLAAIASVQKSTEAWVETHKVNLTGTINIFNSARLNRIPIVYASSAAVYGSPGPGALSETAPLRPLSAYGADKLGCELHAKVASEVHGVPTLGLRFFNVFGPRQNPRSPYSGVISIFCEQIMKGEAITLNGDGLQTRDFVHVSDVVSALVGALSAADLSAHVLNVCTGTGTSILNLVDSIGRVVKMKPALRYGPARIGDIRQSVGSPAMLNSILGVKAEVTLEQGLASVTEWLAAGGPGLEVPRDHPNSARFSPAVSSRIPVDGT